jgi:hypothetical protein
VQFDQMNALLGYLTENCCEGSSACIQIAPATCDG